MNRVDRQIKGYTTYNSYWNMHSGNRPGIAVGLNTEDTTQKHLYWYYQLLFHGSHPDYFSPILHVFKGISPTHALQVISY